MKQRMQQIFAATDDPQELRREVQEGRCLNMKLRRAVICTSLLGMASMAAVTLYQTGIVRRLPDLPQPRFSTSKVNDSDTAWGYGIPDGTLTLLAHAVNIVFAAAGGASRGRTRPALPVLATATAGVQALVAAKYLFYQMPRVEKVWCPYCIVDAVAHLAAFGLTLPETVGAATGLRARLRQ